MFAAAVDAHSRAPQADAIVQTGAGMRMVRVLDMVEGATGKPLVASDGSSTSAPARSDGSHKSPSGDRS